MVYYCIKTSYFREREWITNFGFCVEYSYKLSTKTRYQFKDDGSCESTCKYQENIVRVIFRQNLYFREGGGLQITY